MWTNNSYSKPHPVSHYPDGFEGEADYTLPTDRTQSGFDTYRTCILPAPLMDSMIAHPFSEADLMDPGNPRMNRLYSLSSQNGLNAIWDAPEQNTDARMVEHPSGKVVPNTNNSGDYSKFSSPKSMPQNIEGQRIFRKPETANIPREIIDMSLPFPVKLHYTLSHSDYQQYLCWLPHGRAWRVLNPESFEEKVIPKLFRSHKYKSFMRQVNGWAFIRITEGTDLNAYYHEMFLRGLPNLCSEMKRRPPKVKSAAGRKKFGADSRNPDFYRISKIAPLPTATPYLPDNKLPIATTPSQKFGDEGGSPVRSNKPSFLNVSIGEASITAIDRAMEISRDAHMPFLDCSSPSDSWEENDKDDHLEIKEGESDKVNDPDQQEYSDKAVASGEEQNSQEDAGESAAPISQPQEPGGQLSEADMMYLAHQNRTLLKHAKQV